jgi:hypothetical protein
MWYQILDLWKRTLWQFLRISFVRVQNRATWTYSRMRQRWRNCRIWQLPWLLPNSTRPMRFCATSRSGSKTASDWFISPLWLFTATGPTCRLTPGSSLPAHSAQTPSTVFLNRYLTIGNDDGNVSVYNLKHYNWFYF